MSCVLWIYNIYFEVGKQVSNVGIYDFKNNKVSTKYYFEFDFQKETLSS